jgi:hypothetical protein
MTHRGKFSFHGWCAPQPPRERPGGRAGEMMPTCTASGARRSNGSAWGAIGQIGKRSALPKCQGKMQVGVIADKSYNRVEINVSLCRGPPS